MENMNRKEAAKIITRILDNCKGKDHKYEGQKRIPLEKSFEALAMAIEVLEQDEIIKCKDCIHARPFLERYHCDKLDEDWEISFEANHSCSDGERRESNQNDY